MSQTPSRRRDLVVLVTSLVVLAGASGLWWVLKPEVEAAPQVASIGARPPAQPESSPPEVAAQAPGVQPGAQSSPSAAAANGDGAFGVVPALLLLPSLGLSAEVDRVGVRSDGQVEIPEDGNRVGWYRFGAPPGNVTGSTVLVGHRDTREAGPGVLYRLGEISVGDRVELVREDWGTLTYEVVARESLSKSTLPVDELFREEGPAVLTIITCGGRYTPGEGYEDNLVVTAIPVVDAPAVSEANGSPLTIAG